MTLDDESWMTTKQVCDHLATSSRTLFRYRMRTDNPFPQPDFQNFGAFNKWRRKDVLAWQLNESKRSKPVLSPGKNRRSNQ